MLPIAPLATNRPASLPSSSAARSWSAWTVGSSSKTSSPTSAAAIARRISSVGFVTVSERRSMSPLGWSVMGGEYSESRAAEPGRGRPAAAPSRAVARTGGRGVAPCYPPHSPFPDPWCSGPTCQPVTLEIAGSNPVGSAISHLPTPRPPARTGRSSCRGAGLPCTPSVPTSERGAISGRSSPVWHAQRANLRV